jgi:hypothetical protein
MHLKIPLDLFNEFGKTFDIEFTLISRPAVFRSIVFLLLVCAMFGVLVFSQALERGLQVSAAGLLQQTKSRLLKL